MNAPATDAAGSEIALLGALLFSGVSPQEILDRVPAEALTQPDIRHAWQAARSLIAAEKPVDLITMAQAVDAEKHPRLSPAGIARLTKARPTWILWESDAERVLTAYMRRRVSTIAVALAAAAANPDEDPAEATERALKGLAEATHTLGGNAVKHIAEIMPEVMDHLQRLVENGKNADGFPTGFRDLDKTVSLTPGEMTILAARPSIGKTALALNIATNLARAGRPTGFVSLEMGGKQLGIRLLQTQSGVAFTDIAEGACSASRWKDLQDAAAWIRDESQLYIADVGRAPLSRVRRIMRDMVHIHGCRCIMVDYLQLIKHDGQTRWGSKEVEVAEISADLKGMANELAVPVMALCQLNREAEAKEPELNNLRNSGAIEQDADVVLLLHRTDRDATETLLKVAKNRNGDAGARIKLEYNNKTTTFLSAGYADDAELVEATRGIW